MVERALIGDEPRNHPELIQHYWKKHYGELPQLAKTGKIPVNKVVAEVERRYLSKDIFPILKLEIATTVADTIAITYGDAVVNYPVNPPATTLYLEYERKTLKYIVPLRNAALKTDLDIRAY